MELKRDLGLFSVCSIACGAMLSGIFVLPGHAYVIGGPSVYLAFLLAGLLFVPAALSKAEMATALPESGGDYIFIDRSLGPFVSTMTGLGTWLALILKSAFALVGLSAYLLLLIPVSEAFALYIAAGVAVVLLGINCLGVKKAGQVQSVLVGISLVVLLVFVERGGVNTNAKFYVPLFSDGLAGFMQATAFVVVSYAGVTKVASAAEEVKNPGRNIPLGITISLIAMVLVYTLIAYVYVGVVPPGVHGKYAPVSYRNAPLAQASLAIMGPVAEWAISLVAVMALASMANAGLLASSRYPLAMARYDQLPEVMGRINPTFSTPVLSVAMTGGLIVLSILFLPVVQLAKLASGFLLLIFGILNFSVIIFRESDIEWYNPQYRAPFYPYLQFLGIGVSLVLIPCLGFVPFISTAGLALAGAGWYYGYVRGRVDREPTLARATIGDVSDEKLTASERSMFDERNPNPVVLVPFFNLSQSDLLAAQERMEVAVDLFKNSHRIKVVNIHETADVSFLPSISQPDVTDRALDRYANRLDYQGGCHLDFDRIVTTHSHRFVDKYAKEKPVDWTLLDWRTGSDWGLLVADTTSWLSNFSGDVLLVKEGRKSMASNVLSVVDSFPGTEQSFVVSTADKLDQSPGECARVNFCFDGSVPAEFDELENHLSGYFQSLTGKTFQVGRLGGSGSLSRRLLKSDPEELFVVDGETANRLAVSMPERHDGTIVRPVRSSPDEFGYRDTLSDLLSSDDLYLKTWKPLSKRALFHEIAKRFSPEASPANVIEKNLWTVDKTYGTYLRNGVAVPHAIVPDGPVSGILHTLDRPVAYSDSGVEVDLCITVVGGERHSNEVFSAVAAVDALSRDESIVRRVKQASDPADVLKLFRKKNPGGTYL